MYESARRLLRTRRGPAVLIGLALCAACERDAPDAPERDQTVQPALPADAGRAPSAPKRDASTVSEPSSGEEDDPGGPADSAPTQGRTPDAATPPVPSDAGSRTPSPQADAGAASACPAATLSAGDHRESVMVGGRTRSYLVHVPKSAASAPGLPLVLDFHGYSRSAQSQKTGSGWLALGDAMGIVLVYPEGISSSWNVGGCCGTAGTDNVDDVGFARALIAKLSGQLCIDARRIYASGVSNGAGIAARMACDAGDVFSGVALVSSDLRTEPCKPARPVTEIAFRGTADTLEPYEGGQVGPPGMTFQSPGALGSLAKWKALNECSDTVKTIAKYCETLTDCRDGVEVTLCTMPDVGHSPYDNQLGLDLAKTMWDAFTRVPLRTP